ncbi:hypothetical protein [Streptomyces mirabilis]|uniref:hypothetical protein n=1 Tax=Streptomyces mirabilis TaxID=68239 RepID=UPI0031BBB9E7
MYLSLQPGTRHQTGQQAGPLGGRGEAIQRKTTPKIKEDRARIEARRGKNIAKTAAARKLHTLVYYGLRDGHIRALARQAA